MIIRWLSGLLRHRAGRMAAVATGVVTAVALLAAIGAFLVSSKATMTDRAIARVAVDWQVQVAAGADPAQVASTVAAQPGTRVTDVVGFASLPGLAATTAAPGAPATTQTTGAAQVLGLPPNYLADFPGQLRTLAGSDTGVLVAQQTAANLHVGVGDVVSVVRPGLPDATVTVEGVVDLPQADTLFQTVGAPAGAQPTAPPDNVLLLPQPLWRQLFDPLAAGRPDLISSQVHVGRDAPLPADPAAAYVTEGGGARNTELTLTGAGIVGDNLAATLGAAREDALYAQILFLFLGLPGAVLAGLLTTSVAGAGRQRRQREQALLRTRGATHRQALALAAAEATIIGVVGVLAGLGLAALLGRLAFGSPAFGSTPSAAAGWAAVAAAAGFAVALATILLPAERAWRAGRVVDAGALPPPKRPLWARLGLDLLALAGAAAVISATSRVGYALVLAPEGVATISVDYWAFLGPALLWAGGGLLCWRLADLLLGRGQRLLTAALRPVAGPLAGIVAAGLGRSRALVTRAAVVLALAVAFAVSTAVFNATYQQQALVDARLTNGSDVAVTEAPGARVPPSGADALAAVPGVRAVEPLQHRFAYVGADLQDLYGVRPDTVAAATSLQDSWFTGGTADQMMAALAATPDGILVSAETVTDYQLSLGDAVQLRVQTAAGGAPVTAPFHYVGVANEFPTAPKDSFLVANADYLTKVTADDTVGAFLVDTGGQDTPAVTAALRQAAGPAATVTPLSAAVATIGSSLASIDLHGLTLLELGFAFAFGAAAGGLVLALGMAERRRNFAVLRALGARPRQAAAFVVGEAATVVVLGLVLGAALGAALARVLVAVLSGVFDPPPSSLAVPWTYLAVLAAAVVASIAVACGVALWWARRAPVSLLREG
ncbi:FtsX-like permease family protein [Blastococcus sp. CT_GayMR16]|uniref:FtsX-like permease family protein n=1 Tax=Blastococcus sp. CT_GayMR16 TaxID=2559607 RepID=UPI001073AB6B|nr:FtsX-like permease family protein [Blastococcus sp. CT_GayMR16]TFV91085.1 FtsX-like permease family protein [Blastococcus sp. CT_GayMR16]